MSIRNIMGLVNTTMPFAWDDSMSVYEMLGKLISKINEVVALVNEKLPDDFEKTFYERFREYTRDEMQRILDSGEFATILDSMIVEFSPIKQEVIDARDGEVSVGKKIRGIDVQLAKNESNLNTRGVNVMFPPSPYIGAVGDGIADDTDVINTLLADFETVILPPKRFKVTDTIRVTNSRKLVGLTVPSGTGYNYSEIFYDGVVDRTKTVVLMGSNDVNAEPTKDSTGIELSNITINANFKAGFGVYGTYLTNETQVNNVTTIQTLEYGQYYARSWYATFQNLVSRHSEGKGLAFGMPLEYQNGVKINWVTSSPIEMNNVKIDNIRSNFSGEYYSKKNPGLFDVQNELHTRQGYGIGLGIGNGFNAKNFTSENSGGVNLYVYTGSQPLKHISGGYIENTMRGSSIQDGLKTNMIIEHTSSTGGSYKIEDVYMSYISGGIYHKGEKRRVWLKNIHQPRFLKSLDGLTDIELYSIVLKENVYADAGLYNTLENLAISTHYEFNKNVRYSWEINLPRIKYGAHLVYAKISAENTNKNQPVSSITAIDLDTSQNISYIYPHINEEWTFVRAVGGGYNKLQMGGLGGSMDTQLDFKIITMPTSIY